jgi:hypothetical protein
MTKSTNRIKEVSMFENPNTSPEKIDQKSSKVKKFFGVELDACRKGIHNGVLYHRYRNNIFNVNENDGVSIITNFTFDWKQIEENIDPDDGENLYTMLHSAGDGTEKQIHIQSSEFNDSTLEKKAWHSNPTGVHHNKKKSPPLRILANLFSDVASVVRSFVTKRFGYSHSTKGWIYAFSDGAIKENGSVSQKIRYQNPSTSGYDPILSPYRDGLKVNAVRDEPSIHATRLLISKIQSCSRSMELLSMMAYIFGTHLMNKLSGIGFQRFPLVIHGNSGTGKTENMRMMANHVGSFKSNANLLSCSSTPLAVFETLSGFNGLPCFLDNFREADMSPTEYRQFIRMCVGMADGAKRARLVMKSTDAITGHLMISGEQPPAGGSALTSRCVSIHYKQGEKAFTQNEIDQFDSEIAIHLPAIFIDYLKKQVNVPIDKILNDINSTMKRLRDKCPTQEQINTRVLKNHSILLTSFLSMIEYYHKFCEIDNLHELKKKFEEYIISLMLVQNKASAHQAEDIVLFEDIKSRIASNVPGYEPINGHIETGKKIISVSRVDYRKPSHLMYLCGDKLLLNVKELFRKGKYPFSSNTVTRQLREKGILQNCTGKGYETLPRYRVRITDDAMNYEDLPEMKPDFLCYVIDATVFGIEREENPLRDCVNEGQTNLFGNDKVTVECDYTDKDGISIFEDVTDLST